MYEQSAILLRTLKRCFFYLKDSFFAFKKRGRSIRFVCMFLLLKFITVKLYKISSVMQKYQMVHRSFNRPESTLVLQCSITLTIERLYYHTSLV